MQRFGISPELRTQPGGLRRGEAQTILGLRHAGVSQSRGGRGRRYRSQRRRIVESLRIVPGAAGQTASPCHFDADDIRREKICLRHGGDFRRQREKRGQDHRAGMAAKGGVKVIEVQRMSGIAEPQAVRQTVVTVEDLFQGNQSLIGYRALRDGQRGGNEIDHPSTRRIEGVVGRSAGDDEFS